VLARAAALVLGLLLMLAGGTYLAGELVPGGVLYTRDTNGEWVGTKLWVVEHDGATWVRVARPDRAWYRRLRVDPRVELERDGARAAYRALPHPEPEARTALDAAFRAQNGVVDWWYGVLVREQAIPIELRPDAGGAQEEPDGGA
jgi:hypothetical protein